MPGRRAQGRDGEGGLRGKACGAKGDDADVLRKRGAARQWVTQGVVCMCVRVHVCACVCVPGAAQVLVLDSTPIMPQPKAFVRFARAYMMDNGLDVVTKILPEPVHTWFYTSRWGIGGVYVRLKHKLSSLFGIKGPRRLGEIPSQEMETWTRWATHVAMLDRYENMTQVTIDTVINPSASGMEECIFMYNPNDPYVNPDDVQMVIDRSLSLSPLPLSHLPPPLPPSLHLLIPAHSPSLPPPCSGGCLPAYLLSRDTGRHIPMFVGGE